MNGAVRQARRAGAQEARGVTARPAPWHRAAVLAALMLAAFTLNTVESLPVGLLEPVAAGLRVSVPAAGLLVTGYGLTVAVASVPLARLLRAVPRRHVLAGLLAALVVSSVVSALAASYGVLLAARMTAALAQALFWAVMGPVAVGLFAPEVRGRVVGALSVAGSLALVLGVPAATWLGRHGGWRLPFALPAVLGLVSLVTIAALLPTSRPEEEPAAYAAGPDARRFGTVLAAGFLSATGAFAGYTYIVAFLGRVSGFAPGTVDVLLSVFGAACLAGVSLTAVALDRFPHSSLTTAVTVQTVGMLGLYAAGDRPAAAVVFLVLTGGALGPVFMAAQHAMLQCAPGRTDLALAANSACYHAGIAAGAALGALILPHAGPRGVFLAGGLLTAGAAVVLLGGHPPRRRPSGRAGAAPR
ncbi:MFS transporter [Streptomyces nogalater]